MTAPTLTIREHDVMRRACDGLPNKAIAAELALSERMVESYLARVTEALGARSTREAIRRYTQAFLVTQPRKRAAVAPDGQEDLGLA